MTTPWIPPADVLIIDEKSAVGAEFLTVTERRCREQWDRNTPWGGKSVLLTGDFWQLPPVGEQALYKPALVNAYLAMEKSAVLHQQMRAAADQDLKRVLEEIRLDRLSVRSFDLLASRIGPGNDGIFLFAMNRADARLNRRRISEMPGWCREAIDVNVPTRLRNQAIGGLQRVLHLAVGAPVMLTARLDTRDGAVKGALGYVVRFGRDSSGVVVLSV